MMSKSRLMVAAVALAAAGTFGCAHCDTCDDFPTPCVGPNCGVHAASYTEPGGAQYGDPMGMPAGTNAPADAPAPPQTDAAVDVAPAPPGSATQAGPGVDSASPTPSVQPEGDNTPTPPAPSLPGLAPESPR